MNSVRPRVLRILKRRCTHGRERPSYERRARLAATTSYARVLAASIGHMTLSSLNERVHLRRARLLLNRRCLHRLMVVIIIVAENLY